MSFLFYFLSRIPIFVHFLFKFAPMGHGPQLLGVEPVGKPLIHRLDGTQSRRLLVGPDVGRGRGSTSSRWDFGTKCPEVFSILNLIALMKF